MHQNVGYRVQSRDFGLVVVSRRLVETRVYNREPRSFGRFIRRQRIGNTLWIGVAGCESKRQPGLLCPAQPVVAALY